MLSTCVDVVSYDQVGVTRTILVWVLRCFKILA